MTLELLLPLPSVPIPASTLGPWQALPSTVGELDNFFCPDLSPDVSVSNDTAPYSTLHPSPSTPEFSYEDDGVYADLLARWRKLMQDNPDVPISAKTKIFWECLGEIGAQAMDAYTSERWADELHQRLSSVIGSLMEDILHSPSFSQCNVQSAAAVLNHSQQGHISSFTRVNCQHVAAIAVEYKTERVLAHHAAGMAFVHAYAKHREKDARSVIHNLLSQMNTPGEDVASKGITVTHGFVFTGHSCWIMQTAAGEDEDGAIITGGAISRRKILSGPDRDTPLFPLLIALHFPPLQGEVHQPRHPGALWPTILSSVKAKRREEAERKLAIIRGNRGRDPDASLGPLLWMKYDRPDCPGHPCILTAYQSVPPQQLPSSSVIADSNDRPLPYIPTLTIFRRIATGQVACVFEGEINSEHVILKTMPLEAREFLAEVAAYQQLSALACIPRLLGLYSCPVEGWGGLLLEHGGTPLGNWEWETTDKAVKKTIFEAVQSIHRAGILHGDLAPRNVVVDGAGRVLILDFGFAEKHHCVPEECHELKDLFTELEL
ncbi:hypothetical protein DFH06DRAFT_1132210 [Mycena polygramma]|nr:hypothetical protein DFH06DRAFT_1132210 [Mycena polygramma]